MTHDDYELPTMYTRQPVHVTNSFGESESEEDLDSRIDMHAASSPSYTRRDTFRDIHEEDNRVAWLLLATAFFILFMTLIPVVCDLPNISPMFTGDALWRLFDPLITLPLNLFIITRADVMISGKPRFFGALSEASFVWLLWSLGAAIYVQFHGVHTAAALFKHPMKDFNDAHPELVAQFPILNDIYLNMQTLWEHYIAHYLYAAGAVIMSWVQIFAFRNQIHGPLPLGTKIVWCIGTLVYGLLLASVAIEFPNGLIVGLVYTVVLAIVTTSLIVLKKQRLSKGGLFTMGRRMVIQFYLGACIIAFVIIIAWIGKFGLLNRKAAGIAT